MYDEHRDANRVLWDERASAHAASPEYSVDRPVSDPGQLSGQIITAILDAGLRLTMFVEHDSVPWEALPGRMHQDGGEWRLVEHADRVPLSYTLQAVKPD